MGTPFWQISPELKSGAKLKYHYEKMEYFDDCPICQAIKKAEEEGWTLSLEELRAVFKAAKDQGEIVGGDWFESDGNKN